MRNKIYKIIGTKEKNYKGIIFKIIYRWRIQEKFYVKILKGNPATLKTGKFYMRPYEYVNELCKELEKYEINNSIRRI